jgi:hypothetical protein
MQTRWLSWSPQEPHTMHWKPMDWQQDEWWWYPVYCDVIPFATIEPHNCSTCSIPSHKKSTLMDIFNRTKVWYEIMVSKILQRSDAYAILSQNQHCKHETNLYVKSVYSFRCDYCEYTDFLTCFGLSLPSSEVSSTLTGNAIHIHNTHVYIRISYLKIIYLSIYGSRVLLFDLGHFFSFFILYTIVRTPWTGD